MTSNALSQQSRGLAVAEVHVATAGCDKKVAVWNVVTQRCVATRDSGAAVVSDLAWQVHRPCLLIPVPGLARAIQCVLI